ncbi:MAG: hypothetical protein VB074_00775 [Proteiniphilum sp.]|uniref:hypothetical protein n=1 Tax=Proteiniphilum sp. TaxID=1926877 RepID=UPI000925C500|nr:hypothetical protein [Proteiniphilum sp.]MEA5126694.1 hypothetical protein [Proteiniphilum sp.]OJV88543.1 MAG: hypothetical protein BGO34_18110 [Bacteroidia bacterium 44-10]
MKNGGNGTFPLTAIPVVSHGTLQAHEEGDRITLPFLPCTACNYRAADLENSTGSVTFVVALLQHPWKLPLFILFKELAGGVFYRSGISSPVSAGFSKILIFTVSKFFDRV